MGSYNNIFKLLIEAERIVGQEQILDIKQKRLWDWNIQQIKNTLYNLIPPLTEKEVAWLYRNGTDGWKDLDMVIEFLKIYKENYGIFEKIGLCYEDYKEIILTALLHPGDIYWLWKELRGHFSWRGGIYMEIGSFVGGSLILAYRALKDSCNITVGGYSKGIRESREVHLFAIDPHIYNLSSHIEMGITSRQVYKENTNYIPHYNIEKKSSDAANEFDDGTIDFLFIDDGHQYEEVRVDIVNYLPKMAEDGIILIHDYIDSFPGVMKAVDELLKDFEVLKGSCIVKWQRKGSKTKENGKENFRLNQNVNVLVQPLTDSIRG